jgi:predicted O-methyltransferase YrrM
MNSGVLQLAGFLLAFACFAVCRAQNVIYSVEITLEGTDGLRNTQQVNILAGSSVKESVDQFCSSGVCGMSQSAVEEYVQGVVENARKTWYVNDVLKDSIESATVYDADSNPVSLDSNVAANEGKFLYDLITNNKLKRTMEIGMAYGVSALYISQAHKDLDHPPRSHVAVDPYQSTQWKNIAMLNLQRAKLSEMVELREEFSYLAMPLAVKNEEKYQLMFIDGMHLYDYTLLDFFYADLMLEVGGYMIFDDAHMPSVSKVISYVLTNRRFKLMETDLSNRVSVMMKVKDDDRNWDYHVAF